jgi:hypothetical protein
MNCYTCGTPYDCDCDGDDWLGAARDLLAIIGGICVIGFILAVVQRNF